MSYWLGVGLVVSAFAAAGVAAGWAQRRLGLVSVAHGLVMGSSAYVFAILAAKGWQPGLAMIAGILFGVVGAVGLALASAKVVAEDYALLSFAGQMAWIGLVVSARPITGGVLGIAGVPVPPFSSAIGVAEASLVWATTMLAGLVFFLAFEKVSGLSLGAVVVARSGELASTLGLPTTAIRATVGSAYGIALGGSGVLLASYLSFLGPDSFGIDISVGVLAAAFMAVWRLWAGAVASAVLFGLPETLRLLDISYATSGFVRQVVGGLALMVTAWALTRHRRS